MKRKSCLAYSVCLLLWLSTFTLAQAAPDESDEKIKSLSAQEIPALLKRAETGEASAQYMLARAYQMG
jgi:hypothetical protein